VRPARSLIGVGAGPPLELDRDGVRVRVADELGVRRELKRQGGGVIVGGRR
jgi:hypothetical protein